MVLLPLYESGKKNQNEKSDFWKSLLFLSTEVPVLSNMESGGQCSHVQI